MSTLALFDLVEEWAPLWLPVLDWSIYDAASKGERSKMWRKHVAGYRCRDCGSSRVLNSGGTRSGHGFLLCGKCTLIDGCDERARNLPDEAIGPGEHVSQWGRRHTIDEHEEEVAARARRRAAYLARDPEPTDSGTEADHG